LLTPTNVASRTVPTIALSPLAVEAGVPAAIRIFSGRTPSLILSCVPSIEPAGTRTFSPETSSMVLKDPYGGPNVPSRRLYAPRNPATNSVAGRSYTSSGGPTCSIRPFRITAMRSDIVMASSWSWVT
jgi:hypothetical protein